MLKMQKQTKYNFTPIHLALLQQLENLFSRPNLCSNNYFYKQMNRNFQIPLIAIAQQRRIAQITNNQQILKEALQMCTLLQLIDNKTIRVHQFPTLKFSNKFRQNVLELARNLKIQNRKVLVFQKKEDNEIHLSLLQSKANKQLEQMALKFNKNLQFKTADLHSDLKTGTNKIRKIRQQNKRTYKPQKYSLDKPPGIFIRKAVQTSDQEQERVKKSQQKSKKEEDKQKQKQKQRQRRYRQKPIINEEEFPTLS